MEFYTADALGSALMLTDSAGALATRYTYAPFGRTAAEGVSSGNPFQYTGRENDGLAGLYYYRARYYHPGLQRFLSQDPLGFAAGDVNLYAYVGNNPLNFIDPLGLDREDRLLLQLELDLDLVPISEAGFGAIAKAVAALAGRLFPRLAPVGAVAAPSLQRVPFDWSRADHIFRAARGHFNPTFATSMERLARIFQAVASNPANRNPDVISPGKAKAGVEGFSQIFRSGQQIWVHVRDGRIIDAGVNVVPR
ncbi:MAG: hypothetical protein A3G44_03400 [Candidatus Rokubacteria bacterium RIFCSPLOWO2_12_FULL_73_47]|nr:MAG: hypothetical protein A3G44_03400 [Candidatus Rokubacteria bacterium RIFCSPLOWO2_12_FULL_73_47]